MSKADQVPICVALALVKKDHLVPFYPYQTVIPRPLDDTDLIETDTVDMYEMLSAPSSQSCDWYQDDDELEQVSVFDDMIAYTRRKQVPFGFWIRSK
jgi:hypothetical protein